MHKAYSGAPTTAIDVDRDNGRVRPDPKGPSRHIGQEKGPADPRGSSINMSEYESRSEVVIGPALLDYQELSDWLNDSVRHLRRLVDENRIPYIKVGHFVRFDPVAISEWLASNQRGASL
jgi:excisionase family DNA binding protein